MLYRHICICHPNPFLFNKVCICMKTWLNWICARKVSIMLVLHKQYFLCIMKCFWSVSLGTTAVAGLWHWGNRKWYLIAFFVLNPGPYMSMLTLNDTVHEQQWSVILQLQWSRVARLPALQLAAVHTVSIDQRLDRLPLLDSRHRSAINQWPAPREAASAISMPRRMPPRHVHACNIKITVITESHF